VAGRDRGAADEVRWNQGAIQIATDGLVPVRFLDVTEEQAHLLALADNRLGEAADWDDAELWELLKEVSLADAELAGWDVADLEELTKSSGEPASGDVQDDGGPPENPELICQRGDVWKLGRHTLVCADNREPWAWPTEKAQAVWTDPPYGVEYVGKTADSLKIDNDQQDDEKLRLFLRSVFALLIEHTEHGAVWYVAGPPGPQCMTFGSELMRIGVLRQVLVWVKDRWVMGRSDYHYRHEFVFYGWSPGESHKRPPDRKQDTVFEFPRPSASKDHPTMKPPPLIGEQLSNSTKAGDLVLDPHGGSGSTLIACEQLGLRCWMIEMSPKYCSGIIARWEKATGGNAERISQKAA